MINIIEGVAVLWAAVLAAVGGFVLLCWLDGWVQSLSTRGGIILLIVLVTIVGAIIGAILL